MGAPHCAAPQPLKGWTLNNQKRQIQPQVTPTDDGARGLERVALQFSKIPGVRSLVSLTSGEKVGTTAMPGPRVASYLGMDNPDNPPTGGVVVNNLSVWGDQLRIDALGAWENSDLFNGILD